MNEAETPIDWPYLEEATGGDAALEAEVLALFASQARQYLEVLAAHIDDEDWPAHAHKLKGAARSIGARPLAQAAELSEKAAYSERRGCLDMLLDEFGRLENVISGRLSKNLP